MCVCVCCAVDCGKVCTVCEGLEKCFWWSGAAQWPAPRSRPRCYCVCECHSLRLIEMLGCMLIFYSSSLRIRYAWAACRRITRNNHRFYKLTHNAQTHELRCRRGREWRKGREYIRLERGGEAVWNIFVVVFDHDFALHLIDLRCMLLIRFHSDFWFPMSLNLNHRSYCSFCFSSPETFWKGMWDVW